MKHLNWDSLSHKKKQAFWRKVEICCYVAILLLASVIIASFLWEREWPFGKNGYVADDDVLGNYGDFLAGSVGTAIALVSMYLLFRTLRSQMHATWTNTAQMENQRFNELFFHLLSLYREIMKSLSCRRTTLSFSESISARYEMDKDYSGVKFFEFWRDVKVLSVSLNKGFLAIRSEVLHNYGWFYAEHRNSLGAYYRIIYRILDLVDNSRIAVEEKVRYSKILRAQLSESELLMMYYNSISDSRRKLGNYLWKYNILKHLPALEIRELSKYASDLNSKEKLELDRLYKICSRLFRRMLDKNNPNAINHLFLWMLLKPTILTDVEDNLYIIVVSELAGTKHIYASDYPHLTQWSHEKWKEYFDDMAATIDCLVNQELHFEFAA